MKRLTLLLALLLALTARAGPFPDRPVRIIVPFGAGTSPDTLARMLQPGLQSLWKQSVVVENRTGASGNIAAESVVKSPADGYTLLYATNALIVVNPHLLPTHYDPLKDLQPIVRVGKLGYVLIARKDLGVRDLPELIRLARSSPGKLTYATSGLGSGGGLAMQVLQRMAGISLLQIPMRTGTQMSVYSGEVDLFFDPYTTGVAAAKSARVTPLGVSLAERLPALPDVPAIAEAVPGFSVDAWHGLFAPAGTPAAIVDRISSDVAAVLASQDIRRRLSEMGIAAASSSPAEFAASIRSDSARYAQIITSAQAKPDKQ